MMLLPTIDFSIDLEGVASRFIRLHCFPRNFYCRFPAPKITIVSRETILPQSKNQSPLAACFCIGSSNSGVQNTGRPPIFRSTNRPQWDLTLPAGKTAKTGPKKEASQAEIQALFYNRLPEWASLK